MSWFKLLLFITISTSAFSATYTTSGSGVWGAGVSLPGNSSNHWGSSGDIIYIDHDITTPANFSLGGNTVFTVVIRNGGSLTIGGNMSLNNVQLTIENGADLDIIGSFTTYNVTTSTITINGNMTILGGAGTQVAATWAIGVTGNLQVTGNFNNDTGGINFSNSGQVSISGNVNFHSGSFTNNATGNFESLGTDVLVGHASISNSGSMSFPNATNITSWGGSFDCDGSGSGSTTFGQNVNCSSACAGSGSTGSTTGGCYSNGDVPLPILIDYAHVSNFQNNQLKFEWRTLAEINNKGFYLYELNSVSDTTFLTFVEGSGNSNQPKNYEVYLKIETLTSNKNYLLAQQDFDGKITPYHFKNNIQNTSLTDNHIKIYPNPATDFVTIQVQNYDGFEQAFEITNLFGQIILKGILSEYNKVQVSQLKAGIYFLQIPNSSTKTILFQKL